MTDITETLFAWWEWSSVNSGMPRGYPRHSSEILGPQISDEKALEIDKAVCQLKQRLPDEAQALLTFLKCGCNMADTVQRLHCSTNTARLYVQRGAAWIDGFLAHIGQ